MGESRQLLGSEYLLLLIIAGFDVCDLWFNVLLYILLTLNFLTYGLTSVVLSCKMPVMVFDFVVIMIVLFKG